MQETVTTRTMTCDVCGKCQQAKNANMPNSRSISIVGPCGTSCKNIEMCMTCWIAFVPVTESQTEEIGLTQIFVNRLRLILVDSIKEL